MVLKIKNNAMTVVPGAIDVLDTTINVVPGTGDIFPELDPGDYFEATIQGPDNSYEVVKVTARTGDSFTVERAQSDTVAIPFPSNSRLELRVTVANVQKYVDDKDILIL